MKNMSRFKVIKKLFLVQLGKNLLVQLGKNLGTSISTIRGIGAGIVSRRNGAQIPVLSFRLPFFRSLIYKKSYTHYTHYIVRHNIHTMNESNDESSSRLSRLFSFILRLQEKLLEIALSVPIVKQVLLTYFLFIAAIRLVFFKLGERFGEANIRLYTFIVVSVLHKLRLSALTISVTLLLVAVEIQGQTIAKFYNKRPGLFQSHFPNPKPPKRSMYTAAKAAATKLVSEMSSSPAAAAVGAAAAGAIGWKCLDIYQIQKDAVEKQKDRDAEATERQKDRDAEAAERQKDRDAGDKRQKDAIDAEAAEKQKDRDAEAAEKQKDRDAEDKRQKDVSIGSSDEPIEAPISLEVD